VARRVLAADARLSEQPDDIGNIHRVRRRLRRLRYALEWVGRESDRWSDLQEAFGEVGDLSAALAWLDRAPAGQKMAAARRTWRRDLARARRRALDLWQEARRPVEELA
jgi:CHAD domain-containing protein